MADKFSGVDALRIAIEMEKRGMEMYKRAARLSSSENAKELFTRLESDEREHRDRFAGLYDKYQSREAVLDFGESSEYLSALASEIVFSGGLVGLGLDDGFDDTKRILKNAIDAERDSILFYEALTASGSVDNELYNEIISQEKRHLTELTQMLKEEMP